jgi:hypothetical protein
MKVAFISGPGGANEDPAGRISVYERNSEVRQVSGGNQALGLSDVPRRHDGCHNDM